MVKLRTSLAVFPTGQVGQAAANPGLAYGNSLGPGLAGPASRPYRLSADCLIDRPGLYSLGAYQA